MSKPISRSLVSWPVFASLAILSACSEKDPADVSFTIPDRNDISANIVNNSNLDQSNTEWVGWDAAAIEENGVSGRFSLAPTVGQSGNSLRINVDNIEPNSPAADLFAGPASVTVKPGQAYGVGAFVKGPRCGTGNFVVHASDDPENILAEEKVFFTGEYQALNYYFQVPESGVTSVDLPVHLAYGDNLGGEVFLDRILAMPTIMPTAKSADGNILTNGSFERSTDAIAVGDAAWGQAGSNVTFSVDSTEAYDGEKSVKVEFGALSGGDPWSIEAGPSSITVTPGWKYTFSVWVKGDAGATVNFLVQNQTAYNVYGEQRVTVTEEWQEVTFETTITDRGPTVRLFAQYNFPENANKTIYIDNYKFIPPAICPYLPDVPNLVSTNDALYEFDHVTNGDLENEELVGWETRASGSASAQFDLVAVGDENRVLVHGGNQSLKVSIDSVSADPTDVLVGPTDIYVQPGQTYTYSGFVRGAEGTKARFAAALADSYTQILEGHLVSLNGYWEQITFDFTVPENVPVLTAAELSEAGLPADSVVARIQMAVHLGYPENVNKPILLDDFRFVPNAVVNGDLENSATDATGWDFNTRSEIASINFDSENAHTGNSSVKVAFKAFYAKEEKPEPVEGEEQEEEKDERVYLPGIPTDVVLDKEDVQVVVPNISVADGRKYFLSTRLFGTSNALANIVVRSSKDATELGSADVTLNGNGWQEVTFAVNVPANLDSVEIVANLGYVENALKTIYLDTFRLVSQIPPPERKSANMISNSGFEDGSVSGWNGNGATVTAVRGENAAYSGLYGLHVTGRTQSWGSAQYTLDHESLQAGSAYFASVWVKVDGNYADSEDALRLTLQVTYDSNDENGNNADYIFIAGTNEQGWVKLSGVVDFNPDPTRNVISVKPYVEAAKAETSYYVDELFFTKSYTPNGGLEKGDTTGWQPGGSVTLSVVTEEKHSGEHSLLVGGRTANWNSAQYDLMNAGMIPGRTYLISTWVKMLGETADTLKLTVQLTDEGDDTPEYLTIAESNNTLEWVKLTSTYTYAPVDAVSTFKVYIEGASDTSSYYVDDLIITEINEPINLVPNGNAELMNTTGWNANNATMTPVSHVAGGAYAGNFGFLVTARAANWAGAEASLLDVGLVEGARYEASVWTKVYVEVDDEGNPVSSANDTFKLTFFFNDSVQDHYITVAEVANVDANGWVQLKGYFDFLPAGEVAQAKIYIEATNAETNYYVDELVVKRLYAVNGDLEASAEEAVNWIAAGATLQVVTDDVHSGSNALFVSNRAENWHSAQFDLRNTGMEAGKTYDISAWVKINSGETDTLKMTLQRKTVDSDTDYILLAQSADNADWVKLSVRYTHAVDAALDIFLVYFEADIETTSYYVDDLVITEVDEVYSH